MRCTKAAMRAESVAVSMAVAVAELAVVAAAAVTGRAVAAEREASGANNSIDVRGLTW